MDVPDRAAPRTPRARVARPKGAPRNEPRRKRATDTGVASSARSDASAQSVLALALRRLAEETGAARCAAWSSRSDGTPFVAAARFAEGRALAPRPAELEALASLRRATRIGARSPAALRALARRHGFAAAAPVERAADGPAIAYLLIGPEAGARAVAALEAAARRTAPRLAVADASARLATLDADVRRLDRLAALGDLVAEIVHEIRNPLVSVKTFLQLLPERAAEPEFQGRFREVVAEELRRIERLLDLVLAHAGPGSAPREDDCTELAAVCDSVLQLVSHRAADLGVGVELDAPDASLRVALSGDSLRQVVLNLVLNALDATPRGGRVRLAAAAAAGRAELRVEDEGPGIPAALRERVFEAFFSSKADAPGGLGLAISRRIVEEAGGSIAVGDAPGGGGCFRIRLPLVEG